MRGTAGSGHGGGGGRVLPPAAAEVVRLPAAQAQGYAGIGTLREKRLHMAVKRYLSPDATGQEVPVRELGEAGTARDRIADVRLPDGHIFEVQTGGFYPLRRKIGLYMAHTDSPGDRGASPAVPQVPVVD